MHSRTLRQSRSPRFQGQPFQSCRFAHPRNTRTIKRAYTSYHPRRNHFKPLCAMLEKVYAFSGCLSSNNWMPVFFLFTVTMSALPKVSAACTVNGEPAWTDLSSPSSGTPPLPRWAMGMAASQSNFYVFGGFSGQDESAWHGVNDLHAYNVVSGIWTNLSPPSSGTPPPARYFLGMAASGSKLYIFGGYVYGSNWRGGYIRTMANDLHGYDIASGVWTDLSSLSSGTPPPARALMGMAASGSKLYIFGGLGTSGFLNDLHEYNIASSVWTDLSSSSSGTPPPARYAMGMAASGSKLYTFGGSPTERAIKNAVFNDLHAYDIASGGWADLSSTSSGTPPVARYSMGMAESGSKLYIFGGHYVSRDGATSWLEDLHEYDIALSAWTELLDPRSAGVFHSTGPHGYDFGMAASNSKLFVFGGQFADQDELLHEYDIFCTILDECSLGADNCASQATCTDTEGSFTCACNTGYVDWEQGGGTSCEENQCTQGTHNCAADAACTDTEGSFTCSCNAGFADWSEGRTVGTSCEENQCTRGTHNCAADAGCTDSDGSFTCACNDGYVDWSVGTVCDGELCVPLVGTVCERDPCSDGTHNCAAAAACTDTQGSFTCVCNVGFVDSGNDDGLRCTDSNECADQSHSCDTDAVCANTAGSFSCVCNSGYDGADGTACSISSCVDNCHANLSFVSTIDVTVSSLDIARYARAVAAAAEVPLSSVTVGRVIQLNGRRLMVQEASSVQVPTTVEVKAGDSARAAVGIVQNLEKELKERGLTASAISAVSVQTFAPSASSSPRSEAAGGASVGVMAGWIVGGVLLLLAAAMGALRWSTRHGRALAQTDPQQFPEPDPSRFHDLEAEDSVSDIAAVRLSGSDRVQPAPAPAQLPMEPAATVMSSVGMAPGKKGEEEEEEEAAAKPCTQAPLWQGVVASAPDQHSSTVPVIDYGRELTVLHDLTSGSFKSVAKARWSPASGEPRTVALLVFRVGSVSAEKAAFEKLGRHPYLTQLLAMTTNPAGQECLVTEYAEHGSLDVYLQQKEDDGVEVTAEVLLTAAMQICEGMAQLSIYDVIHRDLACRNVLVFQMHPADRKCVCVKITDYGLAVHGASVSTISTQGGEAGPVRWMAPEAIARRRYTQQSDVFAFGVTMWEMWARGAIPWSVHSDKEIAALVRQGQRLEQPEGCPAAVYATMSACWHASPARRPQFVRLHAELQDALMHVRAEQHAATCVICLERAPSVALFPCRHRCLCDSAECKAAIQSKCPICRSDVASMEQIYDP